MNDTNTQILEKLDILIRISATQIIEGKDFRDQVRILSSIGLKPKEIGDILGKSANNISVTLNLMKKK